MTRTLPEVVEIGGEPTRRLSLCFLPDRPLVLRCLRVRSRLFGGKTWEWLPFDSTVLGAS